MVKAYRAVVSRPDPEREKLSSGSGPVKTSKMSPEEMEDYFARIADKIPAQTERSKKGIDIPVKTSNSVNQKTSPAKRSKPDKEAFLKSIAAGNTIAKTEEMWGMSVNGLAYWVKKWGLVGITPGKARALLAGKGEQSADLELPEAHAAQNASLADYEKKLAEWDSLNQELQQLKLEHMKLKNDYSDLYSALDAAKFGTQISNARCQELEAQIKKWSDNDNETQELLLKITAERDQLHKRVVELNVLLAEMTEDRDNWKQTAQEAKQAIIELEAEYTSEGSQVIGVAPAIQTPGSFEELALQIGALVADKNAAYGDSFAKTGDFLKLLYPTGIQPHQFKDALCLVRIFDKQMRIATDRDAFGESPYRDIVGYGLLGVMKIS